MIRRDRGTLARWVPTLSMTFMSIVSYIDRNTLAVLAPTILRDMRLTNEQYGLLISAFSIAYMVSNPAWGRIIDRIGVRRGMLVAVVGWTFASISHAYAASFVALLAARALLGLGEGATFPGCLRTVVQTVPVQVRARGVAVAYSGASLGALITPLIVTPIALTAGWRSAFWFTGLAGLTWVVVWAIVSRRPELTHAQPDASVSVVLGWRHREVWAFMAADALGAFPSAIVNFFAANYLHQVLGQQQATLGMVLWVPPLGWELGYFFWGWVTDHLSSSGRSLMAVRRQLVVLAALSVPCALIPQTSSLPVVLALMFYVMFVSSGFIITATAYRMNAWPYHAGLLGGLGAASNALVVAITMPIVGRLFDMRQFDAPFLIAILFPIVGVSLWYVLSRQAIDEEPVPQVSV